MTEYAHGADDESLCWQTGYATREDAIADGETEHDEHFVTGRVAYMEAGAYLNIDASELFEGIADTIANNEGEWAEAYEAKWRALADTGVAQAESLLARFRATFNEWAKENDMIPDFYRVLDMEYHDAKPEEEPHE